MRELWVVRVEKESVKERVKELWVVRVEKESLNK